MDNWKFDGTLELFNSAKVVMTTENKRPADSYIPKECSKVRFTHDVTLKSQFDRGQLEPIMRRWIMFGKWHGEIDSTLGRILQAFGNLMMNTNIFI